MRHYLADRQNQIEITARNESIHLCRPCKIELMFRLLLDKFAWHRSQRFNIFAPAVRVKKFQREVSKHGGELRWRHGLMGPERRKHRRKTLSIIFTGITGEFPGAGGQPGHVWGHRQDLPSLTEFPESLEQKFP